MNPSSDCLRLVPEVFSGAWAGEEQDFVVPQRVSAREAAEGISILACLKNLSVFDQSSIEHPRKSIQKRPRSSSGKSRPGKATHRLPQETHLSSKDMQIVEELLSTAGLSSKTVVSLINNQADKYEVQKETGFSHNYIMALQRKVLRHSEGLQLRPPEKHEIGEHCIHVLFEEDNVTPLFIRKELFTCLSMSGTSFSYWRKRAGVEELDTSMDFRLMDQCRSIFGGRATYTLYTAEAAYTILQKMENSRLKSTFTNFDQLKALVGSYLQASSSAGKAGSKGRNYIAISDLASAG